MHVFICIVFINLYTYVYIDIYYWVCVMQWDDDASTHLPGESDIPQQRAARFNCVQIIVFWSNGYILAIRSQLRRWPHLHVIDYRNVNYKHKLNDLYLVSCFKWPYHLSISSVHGINICVNRWYKHHALIWWKARRAINLFVALHSQTHSKRNAFKVSVTIAPVLNDQIVVPLGAYAYK